MPADGLRDIIRARRSVRRYAPRPVPAEVIERLLQAAVWAPSAHNRQPWRWAVLTTPEVKERLARAMGERLRADREADGLDPAAIEAEAGRSYARLTGAPAALVLSLSLTEMDQYPDERRALAEYLMAAQSAAMAAQNLLLAAQAEGLGACWLCAPLFCPDSVRAVLDLPPDWEPQALITLGYPDGSGRAGSRKKLEDVVVYR